MKNAEFFLIAITIATVGGDLLCGQNEIVDPCAQPPACQATCTNLDPAPCSTKTCTNGCVCQPGLLRKEIDGPCIQLQQCPKVCRANEVWNDCGSPLSCRDTCRNHRMAKICPKNCRTGCECKKGFIWDEQSRQCIAPENCPPSCGRNMVWNECIRGCIKTCQNLGFCPSGYIPCRKGCECKQGFLWDEAGIRCISQFECPKVRQCTGQNEEYSNCGPNCSDLCPKQRDPDTVCIALCREGCYCKQGHYRDKNTGLCVLEADCPSS